MKKSFVYLLMVLLLASALSGCGSDRATGDDGMITAPPTMAPTTVPSTAPSASPSASASPDSGSGATDGGVNGGGTNGDTGLTQDEATTSPEASAKTGA